MKGTYSITRTNWNGIELEIRWNPDYLTCDNQVQMAHLEVESISPARAPLPITETGYKSHFTYVAAIQSFGGADEFVEAWLEDAALSPKWLEAQATGRQLSLF